MTEIPGGDGTSVDDLWLSAAEELSPAKSLQAINDKIDFVFKNLALVGTVLAGAGIATDLRSNTPHQAGWIKAVLGLVFLSVVLAAVASMPSLTSKISPSNVVEVERFFTRNIKWRGWLTRLALLLFVGGLLAAGFAALSRFQATTEPTLTLQWTTGPTSGTVSSTVKVRHLARGSTEESAITGVDPNGVPVVLFHNLSIPDENGNVDVVATVPGVRAFHSYHLASFERAANGVAGRTYSLDLAS